MTVDRNTLCARLASQVVELVTSGASAQALLPDIRLIYANQPSGRTPVLYASGIVILFQGRKTEIGRAHV